MSLYSALYAGVSGLSAQSSAMAGVADNITNINTVGYKGVQSDFRTLVTDGRSKTSYTAGGVSAAPLSLISKQGMLQASSSQTDISIDGAGFFVTRTAPNLQGDVAYTRAGSFRPDDQGYLRNTSGLYLQGWKLDAQGNYVDTGNLNALSPVRLNELTGSAQPTTKVQVHANLQSTSPVTAVYAAGDMAAGTLTPTFSRTFDLYDAQGTAHQVTMGFVKTGANQWQAEIYTPDVGAPVAPAQTLLVNGTVMFNGDGSLDVAGSTAALFGTITPAWTNGASSVPIQLSLGTNGGLDGLTQFGSQSALISSTIDGGMLGNVASVDISKTGLVSAVFDDGTSRAVYQLPLATFANPDGLTRVSGNAYTMSADSGNVAINQPGASGSGMIASSTLEASNVDLAQEFTNMIRFQRAYSASSKIITTVDDMLQEVSNLKR